ncbi:MAG: hypothetical protein KKB70_05270 [Proteobacteria bacterium]|nr:hypothetical protein [Pseudomonadota bacterium]
MSLFKASLETSQATAPQNRHWSTTFKGVDFCKTRVLLPSTRWELEPSRLAHRHGICGPVNWRLSLGYFPKGRHNVVFGQNQLGWIAQDLWHDPLSGHHFALKVVKDFQEGPGALCAGRELEKRHVGFLPRLGAFHFMRSARFSLEKIGNVSIRNIKTTLDASDGKTPCGSKPALDFKERAEKRIIEKPACVHDAS